MILITGLTGKSGKWLLRKMENDKDYFELKGLRAIARSPKSLDMLQKANLKIEIIKGETGDEETVRKAMKNVDIVFHIAGIHTSRTIAKVALENNVDWLILVHTTGIYSKYKAAGEEYRQTESYIKNLKEKSQSNISIIRPTMIYGNTSDRNVSVFIKMVDKLRLFPVVSKGNFELQPIHEKDLGEAYYQILKNPSKTKGKDYILSGEEPILLIEMLRIISEIIGKKNLFFSVPFPIAYSGAVLIWVASFGKIDYRERVQRLVEPRKFSHEEATRDFGFNPMSFREGVSTEICDYVKGKK